MTSEEDWIHKTGWTASLRFVVPAGAPTQLQTICLECDSDEVVDWVTGDGQLLRTCLKCRANRRR